MSKVLILGNSTAENLATGQIIRQMGLSFELMPDLSQLLEGDQNDFALLLIDTQMPHDESSDILLQIKNTPAYKRMGIIVMIGEENGADHSLARFLEMGAHDFIPKPVHPLELKTRVMSILTQQEHLKEIDYQNALLELRMEELQLQEEVLTEQKTSIAQANNDITESITYAKRIQEAMLPSTESIKASLPESFILFQASRIVSGDFYWFARKQLSDYYHKLIVAAVDCTGHGVPGAFMSMIGDSLLNYAVHDLELHEPDQILVEMNDGVWAKLHQDENDNRDSMDLSLCMIDKKEKVLKFAGARHHLVYIQNNELFFIKGDTQSIGGHQSQSPDQVSFTKHTIDVSIPTWVYLYSDGYQNQFGGENDKKLTGKRFRQLLFDLHTLPAQEQHRILEAKLHEWIGKPENSTTDDLELVDDVLVWGFKLTL